MSIYKIAAAGLCLAGALSCTDFLSSEKAISDPNNPTGATRNQLFVGVQSNIMGQQEGPVAMVVCEWMQQCAGINGRFVESQGKYDGITADAFDTPFSSIYTAGGLLGIRAVEASATTDGDLAYRGVARVYEALNMMYAADIWGAVPYDEAATDNTKPSFTPQMQVYSELLTLLDGSISDLGGAGSGPGAFDLIYGGDKAKWIEAAHTLKARIYLRRVEKLGNGEYASALTEANQGISTPDNDFRTAHSSATSERNMWAQFQVSSFGADLVAGSVLANLMIAQGDPRVAEYFGKNANGGYGGYDVTTGSTPLADISPILGSGRTDNPSFRQPIITYDENQLIKAEASLQTGNVVAAAVALNAVRARFGKAAIAAPTLTDVMNEKYILTFQNLEAFNDYRRTCIPALKPATGKLVIPSRLFYGSTEAQTNPNTPSFTDQQASPRNENDPNACP
jgi:starch-binding outer membrane protein, SusD/RagB family